MMLLKRAHYGTKEGDVAVPPLVRTALVWGMFMVRPGGAGGGGLQPGRCVLREAAACSTARRTRCPPTAAAPLSRPPRLRQGLSSNTRYQIVFGLERVVDEARARGVGCCRDCCVGRESAAAGSCRLELPLPA